MSTHSLTCLPQFSMVHPLNCCAVHAPPLDIVTPLVSSHQYGHPSYLLDSNKKKKTVPQRIFDRNALASASQGQSTPTDSGPVTFTAVQSSGWTLRLGRERPKLALDGCPPDLSKFLERSALYQYLVLRF